MNKQQISEMMESAIPFAVFFQSMKKQGLSTQDSLALTGQFMRIWMRPHEAEQQLNIESLFDRLVVIPENPN